MRKPVEWQDNPWRPFCSERCKLIDFDKWTSEEYRVPGRSVSTTETSRDPAATEGREDDDHQPR